MLDWNEIKSRASIFSKRWQGASDALRRNTKLTRKLHYNK